MEIQTPLIQYDENNLTLNDLVRLAENLAAQSDPPTLLTYTVQEGDTCIGIALRYGTTMERIIEFNRMENCDLIVTNQILLIPLPTGRETVAEVDLNCDGLLERVRAIPDPNLLDLSANFGVVVEAIPPGGDQFWPIWELTLADLPVAFFGLPVIYPESQCGGFLAVSLFGGTSEFSGVDLYRWNGTTFDRVLDANGYTTEVFSPPAGGTDPFRITTQSLVRDFVNGGCTRKITTYEWNGSIFNEVEQTVAEGVDCLEGGG